MNYGVKYIMLAWFLSISFSCHNKIQDVGDLGVLGLSNEEIIDKYGVPDEESQVDIFSGASLYEYQSTLFDLLNVVDLDTISIVEYNYKGPKENIVIWLQRKDSILSVVNGLKWSVDINY